MYTDPFWSLSQHRRVTSVGDAASRAERRAANVGSEVEALSGQVDRLALACQAMWELLRDKFALTDEDVLERMQEIDLRDGKADGKIGKSVMECPSCQRKASSTRNACLYCGADLTDLKKHLFG